MDVVTTLSKSGILIRLTEESLEDKQTKVLDVVKNPDYIFKGKAKELLAVCSSSKRTYLVVVYKETLVLRSKETESDGFIITAYETTDKLWLFKKELIWNKHL